MHRLLHPSATQDRHGFRYRGTEVSRLEAFSDVVFGFALTLLVVSLEVPRTFDELRHTMRDFPAFAICFALLVLVWHSHSAYFRRYGLQDGRTIVLNSLLLFTILFYVYPLKFLFTFIVRVFTGGGATTVANGRMVPVLTDTQVPKLMITYGVGFAAVFAVFALMYAHALGQRRELELNALEEFETREGIKENVVMVIIAFLSIALALVLPLKWVGASGWIYAVIGPVQATLGGRRDKRRKKLMAKATAAD